MTRPAVLRGIAFRGRNLRSVRMRDLVVRFVFGAGISAAAGAVSAAYGARLGGTLLAFPAILPAAMTLVEEKEGRRHAGREAIGSVLGAIAMVCFAVVADVLLHVRIPAVALPASIAVWLIVAFGLFVVTRPKLHDGLLGRVVGGHGASRRGSMPRRRKATS